MFFPNRCVVCDSSDGPVCETCAATLESPTLEPLGVVGGNRAAFVLNDTSRTIIAALKYRKQRRLSRWLAQRAQILVPQAADAITWIPATPERRRSRGFDQSQELARELGILTGVPVRRLLKRDRNDRRQTGRTRAERLQGPTLRSHRRAPSFVVVIDDVVTTGSSFRAASTTLLANGASRVVGVALAATPDRRSNGLVPQRATER